LQVILTIDNAGVHIAHGSSPSRFSASPLKAGVHPTSSILYAPYSAQRAENFIRSVEVIADYETGEITPIEREDEDDFKEGPDRDKDPDSA
jgi:hypothetical protein